jgi:transcriptional regulator with XRE-family HTH domain
MREQAHMSQAVFAHCLNLTVGYVSQLERGARTERDPRIFLVRYSLITVMVDRPTPPGSPPACRLNAETSLSWFQESISKSGRNSPPQTPVTPSCGSNSTPVHPGESITNQGIVQNPPL